MRRKNFGVMAAIALLGIGLAGCSAPGGLKSSNRVGIGPLGVSSPYASYATYYGYVSPDVRPAGTYKGKDAYYLYFWVPAVIDEVGVSMYSPSDKKPADAEFKSANYLAQIQKDPKAYFDTYLVLERMDIIDPTKIKNGGNAISTLEENDDTSELPANPGGLHYNSLLRAQTETSNPLKALVRGVYRITFTSFRGQVKGSYIATVGTNVPGVKIASSLAELHQMVNSQQ